MTIRLSGDQIANSSRRLSTPAWYARRSATLMVQVQLPGDRVEPGQAAFDPSGKSGQDLRAHRIPRDVVGVVLQQPGDDIVAVPELRQPRVRHRVDRLTRVPAQSDAGPAR